MVIPNAFSLVLVLFVAGCAQFTNRSGDDPLAFLAPGSEMQLVRDLEISSGETRVFFNVVRLLPRANWTTTIQVVIWRCGH